ncbi:MAG: YfhO family protein [Candidatus Goldbacteria bacterium]|nr:YfhO family protein [Candidatus Goldiibacteriota bacterium]
MKKPLNGLKMENRKEKIFVFLLFFTGVFILFKEAVIDGKFVFGHDAVNIYVAFNEFARNAIHKFNCLPSWIPDIYFGMPMIASSSLLFFYPTDLIIILLNIPYYKFYVYDIIIHLFIACWGMYLYLRSINLSRFSAYFGASVIMLSGFILSYIYAGHINNVKAACLIPFAFYFSHKAFSENNIKYFLSAAFILSLQMLATGMQIMAYTVLGILFYLIYFLLIEKDKNKRIKLVIYFSVICVFSLLFSAMQFLPSLNYTNYSWREDFSFEHFVSWSFHPFELITFILPNFFGLYNETYWGFMPFILTTYYFGVTCLLFLPFVTFSSQHKNLYLFFIINIIIFTILSFGKYGILYDIFYYIPVFKQFRNPSRFFYIATFFLIVLSCVGLENIIKRILNEKILFKRFKIIVYLMIVIIFLSFLFFITGGIKEMVITGYKNTKGGNIDFKILEKILDNIKSDIIYLFFISAAVLTIFYLFITSRIKSVFVFILLLILVNFIDNYRIEKNFLKFEYFENLVIQKHPLIDELKKDKNPFRVINFDQIFGPNRGIYYGIEMVSGLHGLAPKYFMEMQNRGILNKLNINRFFNVKYYLIDREINIPDFTQVHAFNGVYLYKDIKSKERLFTTNKILYIKDEQSVLNLMMSDGFTGMDAIVTDFLPDSILDEGQLNIKKYSPVRIESDVITQQGTFVVNTTSYYKNWKVLVDGTPSKLYKVNYNALGTYVPPGTHNILFYFDEKDILVGLILAILSYLFFIVILSSNKIYAIINNMRQQ